MVYVPVQNDEQDSYITWQGTDNNRDLSRVNSDLYSEYYERARYDAPKSKNEYIEEEGFNQVAWHF